MMHYDKVVVTLCDARRNPLREYNSIRTGNGRKSTVYVPFDSEYQFLVKNLSDSRIKIDTSIDGSSIGDLVLEAGCHEYIERFIESTNRFKFVSASHPGVADPTSPNNGNIQVKVTKEIVNLKLAAIPRPQPMIPDPHHPYPHPGYPWPTDVIRKDCIGIVAPERSSGHAYSANLGGAVMDSCFTSTASIGSSGVNINAVSHVSNIGATVEGSHSNQVFGTTVWQGDDGHPVIFAFQLLAGHGSTHRENRIRQLEEELAGLRRQA